MSEGPPSVFVAAAGAFVSRVPRHRETGHDLAKRTIKIRTVRGLRSYTYLGCPLTRNRSPWCFRLCIPDEKGQGECGRIAPHALKSRIQLGIEKHKADKLKVHLEKLERMRLSKKIGYE
jgi:hypothetical protein